MGHEGGSSALFSETLSLLGVAQSSFFDIAAIA
jgi:hypothetical protein